MANAKILAQKEQAVAEVTEKFKASSFYNRSRLPRFERSSSNSAA